MPYARTMQNRRKLIGVVDYFWQRFDHLRKQRMTRQEVMDENKKKNANKKKSKFQQRLEEAMKTAEESKKNRK